VIPIRDTVPTRNPPVAVWVLIVLNSLVFLLEATLPPPELQRLAELFGIVPARYTHPEWAAWSGLPVGDYWPFLTSMFLHGSLLHLVGNMWTLWIFGDNVEDRMGPFRFVAFYLLCGVAGSLVHIWTNPGSTLPTVGASGAIAGVLGAYFFLFPTARVVILFPVLFLPFFFELPAVTYLAWWAISQALGGTLSLAAGAVGGIAFWAHVAASLPVSSCNSCS
jgi:membrane associated rhomboid family serine protease